MWGTWWTHTVTAYFDRTTLPWECQEIANVVFREVASESGIDADTDLQVASIVTYPAGSRRPQLSALVRAEGVDASVAEGVWKRLVGVRCDCRPYYSIGITEQRITREWEQRCAQVLGE